jgi:hypothetical protein
MYAFCKFPFMSLLKCCIGVCLCPQICLIVAYNWQLVATDLSLTLLVKFKTICIELHCQCYLDAATHNKITLL